ATGVAVRDQLPAGVAFVSATASQGTFDSGSGVWTVGTVASGASPTLQLAARVQTVGNKENFAEVSASDQFDPNSTPGNGNQPGENDQAIVAFVTEAIDLSLTKTADPTTVVVGNNVTFTVTIGNSGPSTATGVVVEDRLPSGVTFATATPSQGSYDSQTGLWTVGSVAVGASPSLILVGVVTTPGSKTNTAQIREADQTDTNLENNQASATIEAPLADLSLTKTANNLTPNVDDNVTFTITLNNSGPDTATGVEVTDRLPNGLTYVSHTATSGTYNQNTGLWNVGSLNANGNSTLTIVATLTSLNPVTNTAEVTAADQPDPDSTPGNNNPEEDDQDSVTVMAMAADLSLSKTVDDANPNVGQEVTFQIVVSNAGPNDATGVAVSDMLPAGLAYVSSSATAGSYNPGTGEWTIGSIPNQGSQTLSLTARVDTADRVTNTAEVSRSDQSDPNSTPGNGNPNEDDQDSVTLSAQEADLSLIQSVDNESANVGETVRFRIVVSNAGPDPATTVSVRDQLPAGISYSSSNATIGSYDQATGIWTIGTLAVAGQATLDLFGTIDTIGEKMNTAEVWTSDQFDPDSTPGNGVEAEDDQQTVSVDPPVIDLSLEKTIDDARPILGQTIRYTLTLMNSGPSLATGVVVADELPDGLNFVSSSASSGSYNPNTGRWTVGLVPLNGTATLNIDAVVDTTQTTTNVAEVFEADQFDIDSTPGNGDPNEDDYAEVTFVLAEADLSLSKTVDNATPNVGENVTFTITTRNAGVDPATGVTVLDQLPSGLSYVSSTANVGTYNPNTGIWNIGNIAVNQTVTLTLVATSTNDEPVTNTAEVNTSDQSDPNSTPGNNDPNEDDQDSVVVTGQLIDLELSKTVNDDKPNVGDQITYTLTLSNTRQSQATGVSVRDILPPEVQFRTSNATRGSYNSSTGVWTVGSVGGGETVTLNLVGAVNEIALNVVNTAEVIAADQPDIDSTPDNGDPNEDDQDSVTFSTQVADLELTKTVNNDRPDVGGQISFNVDLRNNGPDPASGVTVRDLLPAGLTFVSATPSRGTYNPQTGIWNVGAISNNSNESLEIFATVNNIGVKTNVAEVATADQADPDSTPGNNVPSEDDQDSVSVRPTLIDLSLEKTATPFRPSVGGELTYNIVLRNAGPDTATGIVVQDRLPTGVTLSNAVASSGQFANGQWLVASLAPQASATLELTVLVNEPGQWTNVVEVMAADQFDFDSTPGNGVPSEDDQDDVTNVTASADLSINKRVSNERPGGGTEVTYTVDLRNSGPDVARDVVVLDQIPTGLTYVSSQATTGNYNPQTGLWSVPQIGENRTETLQIVVRVTSLGEKINTAEVVASSEYDPNSTPGNNDPNEDDQDSVSLIPEVVDLALTKIVDDPTPNVGEVVRFTLELTNQGPSTATGVIVEDKLPPGLRTTQILPTQGVYDPINGFWNVGSIPVGSRPRLEIDVVVEDENMKTNVAEVFRADQPDIDSTPGNGDPNEDDYAEVEITPQIADLELTMTVSDPTPNQNEELFYSIVVINRGPDDATNVGVRAILPPGLNYVRDVESTGIYDPSRGLWAMPLIPAQSAASLQLIVTVDSRNPITNTAEVIASDQFDPNSTPDNQVPTENDFDSATITPRLIDISVAATTNNAEPRLGETVEMVFSVTNSGPETATGLQLQLTLPAGLDVLSSAPERGVFDLPGQPNLWRVGNLAAGETVRLRITARAVERGDHLVVFEAVRYNQADIDSRPGNGVPEEDDQTSLLIRVPRFSKRLYLSSSS
ncbi:MAG: DUF11 domain-containing protein, partial [bacterium]|nr:DUF11 domain-containing protein [bacterium]